MEILNKKFDFKAAVKHFNTKNGTRLKRTSISQQMKGSNILLFKEREGSRWTANEIYALAEIFCCKADDLKQFFK